MKSTGRKGSSETHLTVMLKAKPGFSAPPWAQMIS